MLGWKPRMDFFNAVRKTIYWYRKFYSGNLYLKKLTLNQIDKYEGEAIHA